MKRMVCALLCAALSVCLFGCGKKAEVPIEEYVWALESALQHSLDGRVIACSEGYAEGIDDEGVQILSCIMTASDGKYSIVDKTDDLSFAGEYELYEAVKDSASYHLTTNNGHGVAITGKVTYADGSQARTLIVRFGDYTLNFFELLA